MKEAKANKKFSHLQEERMYNSKKAKGKSCTKAGNQFFIFGVTLTKYMSLGCVWKLIKIVEVNWLVGAPYL